MNFYDEPKSSFNPYQSYPFYPFLPWADEKTRDRRRFQELYPAMDAEQLTDILSRLFFVAQLWGRTDAGQQH